MRIKIDVILTLCFWPASDTHVIYFTTRKRVTVLQVSFNNGEFYEKC